MACAIQVFITHHSLYVKEVLSNFHGMLAKKMVKTSWTYNIDAFEKNTHKSG